MPMIVAVLVALLAGAAHAQIFPRIEKEEVRKRISGGTAQPEEQPQPTEEPAADVDGAAALKRYNELLSGFLKDEKAQRKAMTTHTDDIFAGVRDYYEGVFLLRMGFHKDAERKLKDVGINVRNEKDIETPELLKTAEDIKSGKAYFFRMIAAVMMKYSEFKTEKDAEAAWSEAAKEGIRIRQELENLEDRGKVVNSNITREMTAWLITAKAEWIKLYSAERDTREHPENQNTWLRLIAATGTKQDDRREYTPNFFKQRAALMVVKEFWPESGWVKGGVVDAGLGQNRFAIGQLENVEQYFERQAYHTPAGALLLAAQKKQIAEGIKQFEALKNK